MTYRLHEGGGGFLLLWAVPLGLKQGQVGALSNVIGEEEGRVAAVIPLLLPLLGGHGLPGVARNRGLYMYKLHHPKLSFT